MQTAEYDHNDFDPRFQSEADKNLLVKFFHKTVPNKAKKGDFIEREYIDIRVAGQRDSVARPAREADRIRFPRHYQAFKNRVAAPLEGTPLSEWSMIPATMVERLTHINVKTVEQMASIADVNVPLEVSALGLKQKAKDWLEAHKNDKFLDELRAELDAKDSKVKELEKLVDKLSNKVNDLIEMQESKGD
jgi:hypothetical protein